LEAPGALAWRRASGFESLPAGARWLLVLSPDFINPEGESL
jgi:hypothetical protein